MKIKSTGHKVEDKDEVNVIQDAGSTEKFVAGLHLMREVHFLYMIPNSFLSNNFVGNIPIG